MKLKLSREDLKILINFIANHQNNYSDIKQLHEHLHYSVISELKNILMIKYLKSNEKYNLKLEKSQAIALFMLKNSERNPYNYVFITNLQMSIHKTFVNKTSISNYKKLN